MNFAEPYWLFAGVAACLGLAVFFRSMQKRRQAALERFAAQQLIDQLTRNISGTRRRYKNILLLLAVLFCFAALARPQYGFQWVDVKRKGIDLLFALDTSKSMLAEDIKPNRLTRAHLAILDFVEQLDGDRVGLMPFAGSAYLMCPLTLDYEAFEDSLAAVTTDIIPRGGTNIASVINLAIETLNNAANHKILIVLTDGENLEGDAVKAADEAAKLGLTIYTVGVGTRQGELIPIAGEGGGGFVKDRTGNFITSRLDETVLTTIAEESGGMYVPLGSAGEGLETIYQQKLALIPKEELAERRHKVPLERFEWPLAAAILCLVLELLVGERRKPRSLSLKKTFRRLLTRKKNAAETAVILLLLPGLLATGKAYCSEGEEAFLQGDYLQAAEYYRRQLEKYPDDPQLLYNFGASSFKNNMYDDAIEAFAKALKSDDITLQEKAYYNRGNSYYQKGAETLQADPQATIGLWQQALTSLEAALELAPDDEDARHNHEVIKKRLEELEKQQQKEDNEEEQQQDSDGDEQQQDSDQQQSDSDGQQSENNQPGEQPDTGPENRENDTEQTAPKQNNSAENEPRQQNEAGQETNSQKQQAKEDAIRQQLGKMTREEAEKMLNALKNEEGELNFVPAGGKNQNDVKKDW